MLGRHDTGHPLMSLAELPRILTVPTAGPLPPQIARGDVLAHLLRDIRVHRSLQFCFEPHGAWMVDATPGSFRPPGSVSFHIIIEGRVWIDPMGGRFTVEAGDVVVFPRGSVHFIGAGEGGRLLNPGGDLPAPPWATIPILAYPGPGPDPNSAPRARILCGFLEVRVLDFQPLLEALPEVMIARTAAGGSDWLGPAVGRLCP